MTRVWGIHGRKPRLDLVGDGVIALERPRAGDVAALGNDASALFARLRDAYPDRPHGQLRGWTAALLRFAFEAHTGDLVLHPDPKARTFDVGTITGEYRLADPARGLHTRVCDWSGTGVPYERLSHQAQFELVDRAAFFPLRTGADELAALVRRAA